MNAQQQDILRLLTSRGPMTSRALFDIMQDELGYYGFAANHDQIQRAVELLSKILSKMKAENLIDGSMQPQTKGRPVMFWDAPITEKSDGEIYAESSARHTPPELHDMAQSVIGNLTSPGYISDNKHSEMASDVAELDIDAEPEPRQFITRVTRLTVGPKGEGIFSDRVTHIEIDDEGLGEYLKIMQGEETFSGIRVDVDEWPAIAGAIDMMIEHIQANAPTGT